MTPVTKSPAVQSAEAVHVAIEATVSLYGKLLETLARENEQLRAELAICRVQLRDQPPQAPKAKDP